MNILCGSYAVLSDGEIAETMSEDGILDVEIIPVMAHVKNSGIASPSSVIPYAHMKSRDSQEIKRASVFGSLGFAYAIGWAG